MNEIQTIPSYLPPLNQEDALVKGKEIDALIGQICSHEERLSHSYARLGSLLREVKLQQYWIAYGFDRFSSYLETIREKIDRRRSQLYAILSVAEVLLPHISESKLEEIGITKAHELRRLVQNDGNVHAEINDTDNEDGDGNGCYTVQIMDYALRPKVTAAQLRVKVNELLHVHELPSGLWLELPGFYATPDERKEIDEFWKLGKQVLEITSESEHELHKQVFLAAVRESVSTWRGELSDVKN
jgi:hypothetical protein